MSTPEAGPLNTISVLLKRADLVFAAALFFTVLLLILPVPAFLLDAMLAVSIGFSLLVLLVIIYVKDPPEFSGFPTILLAFTLFPAFWMLSSAGFTSASPTRRA